MSIFNRRKRKVKKFSERERLYKEMLINSDYINEDKHEPLLGQLVRIVTTVCGMLFMVLISVMIFTAWT